MRDISHWEECGRAHGELVGHIRPATSLLGVSSLVSSVLLVEIEADAFVGRRIGGGIIDPWST